MILLKSFAAGRSCTAAISTKRFHGKGNGLDNLSTDLASCEILASIASSLQMRSATAAKLAVSILEEEEAEEAEEVEAEGEEEEEEEIEEGKEEEGEEEHAIERAKRVLRHIEDSVAQSTGNIISAEELTCYANPEYTIPLLTALFVTNPGLPTETEVLTEISDKIEALAKECGSEGFSESRDGSSTEGECRALSMSKSMRKLCSPLASRIWGLPAWKHNAAEGHLHDRAKRYGGTRHAIEGRIWGIHMF